MDVPEDILTITVTHSATEATGAGTDVGECSHLILIITMVVDSLWTLYDS